MLILVHRAHTLHPHPEVTLGVELDLRDAQGQLVLSHDPVALSSQVERFDDWMVADQRMGERPWYALNIKADGLEPWLIAAYERWPILQSRSFLFDASYPTHRRLRQAKLPVADRVSDEESIEGTPWAERSSFLWLDRWSWHELTPTSRDGLDHGSGQPIIHLPLRGAIRQGQPVRLFAVSPELHRPMPLSTIRWWWNKFAAWDVFGICTDYPEEATYHFATNVVADREKEY